MSKKLNFPTKEDVLPSDKSSTPKANEQSLFITKTQNCSTGELASKKPDIMNNDSQEVRSERTAESDTMKSLPKSIIIGSIKSSNIFIQSIVIVITSDQNTLKSNALRADHINNQIRKPELNISEAEEYKLSNRNPKPTTSNKTFENIFKAEIEREAEILMEKMIGKIYQLRKPKRRMEKINFQGNGQEYFPKRSQLLTHFVA